MCCRCDTEKEVDMGGKGFSTRIDPSGRVCTKCKQYKLWIDFDIKPKVSNGYSATCTNCRRKKDNDYNLLRNYGINKDQREALWLKQNGKCKICKRQLVKTMLEGSRKRIACVDHNHVTDIVRGLLCDECNGAVGIIEKNRYRLQLLITYIDTNGDIQ